MRAALPGTTLFEPKKVIAMNAPCFHEQKGSIKLTNDGPSGIFWIVTPSSAEKYNVEPANGFLKSKVIENMIGYLWIRAKRQSPQTSAMLELKVRPFFFRSGEVTDDHLRFEWCDTPATLTGDGTFNADFFSKAKVIQRHVMPFRYNSWASLWNVKARGPYCHVSVY